MAVSTGITEFALPAGMRLVPERRTTRGWKFWVGLTLLGVLVAAGIGVGAFFAGQATRPSHAQLDARVAHQAAQDKTFFTGKMNAALSAQRDHLQKVMNARVKKARDTGYTNGQAQGFSAGQAQGYSSGQLQGKAEGRKQGKRVGKQEGLVQGYGQGFDEGTCYDPVTYDYVC